MAKEYSASMAAKLVGASASSLKQWEKHFPELATHQDAKGSRIYTDSQIELLKQICHLTKERGFTIEGAKKELETGSERLKRRQEAITQLQSLRTFLVDLKSKIG